MSSPTPGDERPSIIQHGTVSSRRVGCFECADTTCDNFRAGGLHKGMLLPLSLKCDRSPKRSDAYYNGAPHRELSVAKASALSTVPALSLVSCCAHFLQRCGRLRRSEQKLPALVGRFLACSTARLPSATLPVCSTGRRRRRSGKSSLRTRDSVTYFACGPALHTGLKS